MPSSVRKSGASFDPLFTRASDHELAVNRAGCNARAIGCGRERFRRPSESAPVRNPALRRLPCRKPVFGPGRTMDTRNLSQDDIYARAAAEFGPALGRLARGYERD